MGQNNLSYRQAADKLGKSPKTIDRWLAGEVEPWDAVIRRIAPIMGVTVEDFYPETAPVKSLSDRVDVLEDQFAEAFEDLDERVAALEQFCRDRSTET